MAPAAAVDHMMSNNSYHYAHPTQSHTHSYSLYHDNHAYDAYAHAHTYHRARATPITQLAEEKLCGCKAEGCRCKVLTVNGICHMVSVVVLFIPSPLLPTSCRASYPAQPPARARTTYQETDTQCSLNQHA